MTVIGTGENNDKTAQQLVSFSLGFQAMNAEIHYFSLKL